MKLIDIEQGSEEWKNLRKNKIGASDSSSILGISPWVSPYQLWSRKLGLIPEVQINSAMKKGMDLEPIAREKFSSITGIKMEPIVAIDDVRDWQLASLDGWDKKNGFALEIKCGGQNLFDQANNIIIPEYYKCQMQHQMSVLGIDFIFYFVYFEGNGKIIEYKRDNNFITRINDQEKIFWDSLQNLEAPDLSEKDFILKQDEEWKRLASEWKNTKSQLKNLEETEILLRNQLIGLSGKSNCMGEGIKLSRVLRKGLVDYSKVQELQNIDLNKYRKDPIESYRIQEI